MTKPSMPRKRSCFIRNKFATANRKSTINVFSHWIAFALNWKGLISVLSYAYILMPIIVSMCASLNASHGISTFTSITRQSTSILSAVIEFRFACYQKTLQHHFFRVTVLSESVFSGVSSLCLYLSIPNRTIYLLALLVFTVTNIVWTISSAELIDGVCIRDYKISIIIENITITYNSSKLPHVPSNHWKIVHEQRWWWRRKKFNFNPSDMKCVLKKESKVALFLQITNSWSRSLWQQYRMKTPL